MWIKKKAEVTFDEDQVVHTVHLVKKKNRLRKTGLRAFQHIPCYFRERKKMNKDCKDNNSIHSSAWYKYHLPDCIPVAYSIKIHQMSLLTNLMLYLRNIYRPSLDIRRPWIYITSIQGNDGDTMMMYSTIHFTCCVLCLKTRPIN